MCFLLLTIPRAHHATKGVKSLVFIYIHGTSSISACLISTLTSSNSSKSITCRNHQLGWPHLKPRIRRKYTRPFNSPRSHLPIPQTIGNQPPDWFHEHCISDRLPDRQLKHVLQSPKSSYCNLQARDPS